MTFFSYNYLLIFFHTFGSYTFDSALPIILKAVTLQMAVKALLLAYPVLLMFKIHMLS